MAQAFIPQALVRSLAEIEELAGAQQKIVSKEARDMFWEMFMNKVNSHVAKFAGIVNDHDDGVRHEVSQRVQAQIGKNKLERKRLLEARFKIAKQDAKEARDEMKFA